MKTPRDVVKRLVGAFVLALLFKQAGLIAKLSKLHLSGNISYVPLLGSRTVNYSSVETIAVGLFSAKSSKNPDFCLMARMSCGFKHSISLVFDTTRPCRNINRN